MALQPMASPSGSTEELESGPATAGNTIKDVDHGPPTTYLQRRLNVLNFKRPDLDLLSEVSGALGDLGTYVPITVALTLYNHIDLGTTLIFNGFFNVLTGLMFDVPMAVQPMKSIAAVALSTNKLTVNQIMAAGLSVSFILVFLGLSGLMTIVNWLIPLSVVRGIQLTQGLHFTFTAVNYILHTQDFSKSKATGPNRPWKGWDGRVLAIFAFCFVVIVSGVGGEFGKTKKKTSTGKESYDEESNQAFACAAAKSKHSSSLPSRLARKVAELNAKFFKTDEEMAEEDAQGKGLATVPSCLIIFVLGIILAFARYPSVGRSLKAGPATPKITHPTGHDWREGFIRGAIPQLPLSVLNSVIAVVKLSQDLFPSNPDVTSLRVATSVGMMNIVGCWFGAMPVCHGCGGLAGQYRFGARTGLSVVMLGAGKMLLGLLLGSSLTAVLQRFPVALLGALLLHAGIELAMTVRDMNSRKDIFTVLVITAVGTQWNNLAYGVLCGLAVALVFKARAIKLKVVLHPRSKPES